MSQQLWDMSADKIKATELTDTKLTFLERKFNPSYTKVFGTHTYEGRGQAISTIYER